MIKKVMAILLSSILVLSVPVSFIGCSCSSSGTGSKSTMTDKEKRDAEYAKKLMDEAEKQK